MVMIDAALMGIGKELIDYQALEVRIRMLENEFKVTSPKDSHLLFLLQTELEIAYKTYMMHYRNLTGIRIPAHDEILLTCQPI